MLIKPFESNYKIYIIHDAHTMGVPAQNTLLKTLEEAPSYGVIILITDNLSALLPTIISRSQNYKFQPLKEEVIENYLQRHQGLELSKAREISLWQMEVLKGNSVVKGRILDRKDRTY